MGSVGKFESGAGAGAGAGIAARSRATRRTPLLAVIVAAAFVLALGAAPAWAYFTDSSQATGGITVNVKPHTDITETYGSKVKHVVITNSEDATSPVFVRARVYSVIPVEVGGSGWTGPDAEGWYVYGTSADAPAAVAIGGQTTELAAAIAFPADGVVGDSYNVVVVYESTPAQYAADGSPAADWTFILDSGNGEGGN